MTLEPAMPSAPTASRPPSAAGLVAAAVTGLIAFALFVAGGLLLWGNNHYKDAQGYITTPTENFGTSRYALTVENLDVNTDVPHALVSRDHYGALRLRVAAKAGKPVFVGIARTDAVRDYLGATAHSSVDDLDFAPFKVSYRDHAGSERPGAPAGQAIWATSAEGAGPLTLRWPVESGNWSVVVMNADGSPGVRAAISAGAKLPFLTALGFGTLGLGLLFVGATAALTVLATRPRPPRPPAQAPVAVTA
jgi:hypothetical protein